MRTSGGYPFIVNGLSDSVYKIHSPNPGDYPCTKLQMEYQKSLSLRNVPFLLKPEKMREYAAPAPITPEVPETENVSEIPKVAKTLSTLEISERTGEASDTEGLV
ncbi:MAG: hypothetical protein ACHQUC_10460 [Chlamydiales bacterium]